MEPVKTWLTIFLTIFMVVGLAATTIASLVWLVEGGPILWGLAALIVSGSAFFATIMTLGV